MKCSHSRPKNLTLTDLELGILLRGVEVCFCIAGVELTRFMCPSVLFLYGTIGEMLLNCLRSGLEWLRTICSVAVVAAVAFPGCGLLFGLGTLFKIVSKSTYVAALCIFTSLFGFLKSLFLVLKNQCWIFLALKSNMNTFGMYLSFS